MITREVFVLILVILAGVGLGAFFFAGLWWTVNKSVEKGKQGVVLVLSFLLRVTLALAAFFLVGRGHPDRMAACLIGFIVGRGLLMHTIDFATGRGVRRRVRENGRARLHPSPGSGGDLRENTDAPES
jgi:F1F0 ATPase subunit 2